MPIFQKNLITTYIKLPAGNSTTTEAGSSVDC